MAGRGLIAGKLSGKKPGQRWPGFFALVAGRRFQ
jgi:hypothetical protein